MPAFRRLRGQAASTYISDLSVETASQRQHYPRPLGNARDGQIRDYWSLDSRAVPQRTLSNPLYLADSV